MKEKNMLPYGTWPSQITPELTGDLLEFSELCWSEDGRLLWMERHSNQSSLMAWDPGNGAITNLSGDLNIGGGIMYGGGSFAVQGDKVVFIEKGSNQIYLLSNRNPFPQIIQTSNSYKSSPLISPDGKSLVYISSDGENDSIDIIDLITFGNPKTFRNDADFYNYIRWHPSGTFIAWIAWDHPHMPWQESQLDLVDLKFDQDFLPKAGLSSHAIRSDQTSILQPEFSPDGQFLAYLSDEAGWWQIYLMQIGTGKSNRITSHEFDHCLPPWVQNQRFYGFSPDSSLIYCIRNQAGFASLWQIDISTGIEEHIQLPQKYSWLESITISPNHGWLALVASGGRTPPEIIVIKPETDPMVIRQAIKYDLAPGSFSSPEAVSWKTEEENLLHGLFYQPENQEYTDHGKPPLIVIVHSGPTRQKYADFEPRVQYFTSRGYAVLEVNYRGSTGYGRVYWEALKGQWGLLDVEDVYHATRLLTEQNLVDPDRIALLGSSSGGLTVLQLLIKYPQFFKAGISLYGVTNLNELNKNPPKFERYYLHWLIGDPKTHENEYRTRSPLFSAEKIQTPTALFQGAQDPIVPIAQAEQIVKALQQNNIPFEYHVYPDEGHSFKKAENIRDFYEKTELFLSKYILGTEELERS